MTPWLVPVKQRNPPLDAMTLGGAGVGEARGSTGVTPGSVGGGGQTLFRPPPPTGTAEPQRDDPVLGALKQQEATGTSKKYEPNPATSTGEDLGFTLPSAGT